MDAATEDIVGRVLEPVFRALPEDAARRIVDLEAGQWWQQRIEELASKANEGALASEDMREYEALVVAGDLLAILQAVARRGLT